MEDDLIICTRNRPRELRTCLESVRVQTRPPSRVLVVDAGTDGRSAETVAELAASWPAGHELAHRFSEPGLVRQRIAGLAATDNPTVHFVDDDTRLEPGYLEAVSRVFASDPAIGGVGGFITNQPPRHQFVVDVWLGLTGRREGAVLPSGRNVRVYLEPSGLLDVDWLPGAAMSYRREVLDEEPPNPRWVDRHEGEDVELSYRVSQRHRLVVAPDARLSHDESPVGRRRRSETVRDEVVGRWLRVREGTGSSSRAAFWVSALGQLVWSGLKGLVSLSPSRLAFSVATARGIAWVVSLSVAGSPSGRRSRGRADGAAAAR